MKKFFSAAIICSLLSFGFVNFHGGYGHDGSWDNHQHRGEMRDGYENGGNCNGDAPRHHDRYYERNGGS